MSGIGARHPEPKLACRKARDQIERDLARAGTADIVFEPAQHCVEKPEIQERDNAGGGNRQPEHAIDQRRLVETPRCELAEEAG